MSTKFWRSELLAPNSREAYAIHEASHAVMAVTQGCDTYAHLFDTPLKDGTNGVCHIYGNIGYEEDLRISLAGPEGEFMVTGGRSGAYGDNQIVHQMTTERYARITRRGKKRLKAHGFHGVRHMADRDYENAYEKIDAMLEHYREAIEELAYRMYYVGWISNDDVLIAMGYPVEYPETPTEWEYE